jgi:serine protease Do
MTKRLGVACIVLAVLAVSGAPAPAQDVVPDSQAQVLLSFAPVVKKAAPAVVNIYTRKVIKERSSSPFFDDPFFRQFFGDEFGIGRERERVQNSLGSGVIVASDGLVVTNHHVIADADEIIVVLNDGREFDAKVVGREEHLDLALLRLDAKGESFPALEMLDSDELEIGDLVLAIGNPFGVGQTVTSGIVSGLARTQTGINDLGFFIQTDAAINPGNSGGALVDMNARLVGINTAIFSRSGGSIGIGFAIPSNMVRAVVESEASGGKLVRPWTGISGETLTADIAKSLKIEKPGGVVVREVFPGGPGESAGLRPGDVLLAVNDKSVDDPQGMAFRLATLKIGTTARLSVWRRGEIMQLPLELVAPPREPAPDETLLDGRQPLQGALVANLSPALAQEYSIDAWSGVAVLKIRRGSYADEFGFRDGDVIAKINGVAISTVKELAAILANPAANWTIEFMRAGKSRTIEVH